MTYNPARELLIQCLKYVMSGNGGHYIENPAVEFSRKAKCGDYNDLSDDRYMALLHKVEHIAKLWCGQPRRTSGEILACFLERTNIPSGRLGDVADPLMKWYKWDESELDDHGNPLTGETEIAAALNAAFVPRRPAEIRDAIAARVLGQAEAVKAAAMIVHGQLAGRRTNAMFCGPSGSGKSEIWRVAAKEFPGLVRMIDASRMSGEGWAGGVHLRNVFDGVNPDDIRRRGLVVVFDEADKILTESAVGASGTDHHRLTQNNMLKMLDGDVIEFGAEGSSQPAFSIDCSNVSVVLLGAFENLMERKSAAGARHIGFGTTPESPPPSHKDISYDDLIRAGTRREIAGRINRIVAMEALDADSYKSILRGPVLSDIEKDFCCRLTLDDAAAEMLSEQAVASGLGVRWARSAVRNALEDELFDTDMPEENYIVTLHDGELRCQAYFPDDENIVEPQRVGCVCRRGPDERPGTDGGPLF